MEHRELQADLPKWVEGFCGKWGTRWIRQVARTSERDLRGHMIALTYHQYAIALRNCIYRDNEHWNDDDWDAVARDWADTSQPYSATWFNFATWATATINRDIRTDVVPVRSGRLLPFGLRGSLTPTVLAVKNADRQRMSELLTWYQRLVFISTTLAFLDMVGKLHDDDANDEDKGKDYFEVVDDFVNLRVDTQHVKYKPPLSKTRHLLPIQNAFKHYLAAAITHQRVSSAGNDTEKWYFQVVRERRVFLAGLILTAVEQDVVQPGVQRVIEFVPRWASNRTAFRTARIAAALTGIPRQVAGLRIPAALSDAEQTATDLWARMLTDQVLVLAMPAEVLRLGRDIPPVSDDSTMFPNELRHLNHDLPDARLPDDWRGRPPGWADSDTDAVANRTLQQLVASFDRSHHHGEGSAAADWRRYLDRMNWAVTLLRSRQQEKSLFWPPYVDEDVKLIMDGRRPMRSADPCHYEVMPPLQMYHDDVEAPT